MIKKLFYLVLGLIGGVVFFSQSAIAQENKEPTKLQIKVQAMPQVNLNEQGRPSPIKVRIYELKESAIFEDADYFSLNTNDKTVLAADMLSRDEFILRPGETRVIERKSNPKTKSLGILAGYQDLNMVWRVVYPLEEAPEAAWYRFLIPANKLDIAVQLQSQGIVVVPSE